MSDFTPRIYYRLAMKLISPLSVGSGMDESTDHDVILDSFGRPFIPATAIAGVLRHSMEKDQAEKLFGDVSEGSAEQQQTRKPNHVIVYDARMISEKSDAYIINRDSVALRNKVGIKGMKFDMQAVEPGVKLVSYIELLDAGQSDVLEKTFAGIASGVLCFGTKTSRGYGKIELTVMKTSISNFDEYIAFAVYDEKKWNASDKKIKPLDVNTPYSSLSGTTQISLHLKCCGGISIREYSTDVGRPDYGTLSLHDKEGKKNIPVIPGTSWAGAFRERYAAIINNKNSVDALFGQVYTKREIKQAAEKGLILPPAIKSRITFSETRLENGVYKNSTRNATDRFSGATKDAALYTERTYYNGETDLIISIEGKLNEDEKFALACVLTDLHNGFLAVGGVTSIGRGLFKITNVNGDAEAVGLLDADSPDISGFIKKVFPDE